MVIALIKTCQNCGHIRTSSESNSIDECPKCGVYYKKIKTPIEPAENKTKEKFSYWDLAILEIKSWCFERFWFLRIPVLVYFTYLLYVKLTDWQGSTIFDGINLGIHEMGHPLFSFFGRFLHIAGGTILQCSAPILSMIVLGKQRDYFGIAFCIGWLATNLISVSVYMLDANDLALTLVTIGGNSEVMDKADMHDWNNLFDYFGLLPYDKLIGGIVYWIGILMLAASIALGSILVYWMIKVKKEDLQD